MDIYACKLNLKVLSKEVILEDIMNTQQFELNGRSGT